MADQHQLLLSQIMEQFQNVEDRNSNRSGSVEQGVRNSIWFNPKIEFPCFDGNDPKGWIKKYTRYFTLCKVMEEQKVNLAALRLRGQAEVWFNSYILGRRNVAWEDFIFDLCARFRDNLGSKIVEEFNKLTQVGLLGDYIAKFEDLKPYYC